MKLLLGLSFLILGSAVCIASPPATTAPASPNELHHQCKQAFSNGYPVTFINDIRVRHNGKVITRACKVGSKKVIAYETINGKEVPKEALTRSYIIALTETEFLGATYGGDPNYRIFSFPANLPIYKDILKAANLSSFNLPQSPAAPKDALIADSFASMETQLPDPEYAPAINSPTQQNTKSSASPI